MNDCGCHNTCSGCSSLAGWASQSLLGSLGMSGLSGWGGMSGPQDVWPGDPYVFIVNIGPQYAESGTGALISLITGALEGAGLSYDTSATFDTGMLNPWFVVRGNSNVNASSPDDLQNQFIAAINQALQSGGFQSAQVINFGWKGITTHNTDVSGGGNNPPFYTPLPGVPGGGVSTLPGSATLAQLQANCAAQGLTYDARSTKPGGCECGFFDQMLVDVGLKSTCQESALGFKSGAATGVLLIGALVIGFLIIREH